MADNRSYAALEWVIGEIGETLKQARQALEAYVENTEDTTRIRFCLTHIHQVHGSLQMVEFYGAALLAEEMENLAQSLMNKTVRNEAEAQEVLMRAILQLPVYLEQVKKARKDHPSSVLPLLNDLRAVRGEALLTETKLFTPNLAPAHHVGDKNAINLLDPVQFPLIVQKLRKMYQVAAAGVIKDHNRAENIAYLYKVFGRLRKLTVGTARQPLWDIALALLEGLEQDGIESSASVKNLLRQLDQEIKTLAADGVGALNTFTNDELIKNLLYYIARSSSTGKHVLRIQKAYKLESALPEAEAQNGDDEIMAPDLEAIRSVVAALKDELDAIKHALDVSLTDRDKADIDEAIPIIKRVADTMAVLGIGDLRKQILAQGEMLESARGLDEVPADVLMQVAGKIIEIESSLELMASGSGKGDASSGSPTDNALNQAQESVLRESRNGLEQAKDAIIEYIASQWNREHLANVPAHLREIAGGLDMIPLKKPAAILGSCASYVQEQLLNKVVTPEWTTLDTLADAIASVEYYLERLSGDRQEEDEMLLGVAEDSVRALGYPIPDSMAGTHRRSHVVESNTPDHGDADAASVLAKIAAMEDVELASAPDFDPAGYEAYASTSDYAAGNNYSTHDGDYENAGGSDDASIDYAQREDTILDADDGAVLASRSYDLSEDDSAGSASSHSTDHAGDYSTDYAADYSGDILPVAEDAGQTSFVSDDSASHEVVSDDVALGEVAEDDLIDDEILEIFIEEAGEVIATINEFFPKWAEDFDDQESLTEFRRAFHTLKGSGRMVNANDVGELAWAVENMLNRVIDHTVEPNEGHVALIRKVVPVLPAMVEAFRLRQPNPHPQLCAKVAEWAEGLSQGNIDPQLLEDGTFDEPQAAGVSAEAERDEETQASSAPEYSFSHFSSDEDEAEDDDGSQSILWEIFGSEALTHLQEVQNFIAEMDAAAPIFQPPSEQMQRALHTLKGSAHMADVKPIAELVTPLERFVKELRVYQVNIDADILQLLKDAADYIQLVLSQIEQDEELDIPKLSQFVARVAELKERSVAPLIRQREAEDTSKKTVDPALLSIFMAEEMRLLLDVDEFIAGLGDQLKADDVEPLIAELKTLEKGSDHANLPPMADLSRLLRQAYEAALQGQLTIDDRFREILNRGHAELLDMVDAVAVGQNLSPVSEAVQVDLAALLSDADGVVSSIPSFGGERARQIPQDEIPSEEVVSDFSFDFEMVAEAEESAGPELIEVDETNVDAGEFATVDYESIALEAETEDSESETGSVAFEPVETESSEIENVELENVELENVEFESFNLTDLESVDAESNEGESAANEKADVESTNFESSGDVESTDVESTNVESAELELAEFESDELDAELEAMDFTFDAEDGAEPIELDDLIIEAKDTPEEFTFEIVEETEAGESGEAAEEIIFNDSFDEKVDDEEFTSDAATTSEQQESVPALDDSHDTEAVDVEIFEIFIEEAEELLEEIDESVHDWEEDWSDTSHVEALKRALHTLKGGARLAGLMGLGELAHEFESYLIAKGESGNVDEHFFALVHEYQDKLISGTDKVKSRVAGHSPEGLEEVMSASPNFDEAVLEQSAVEQSAVEQPVAEQRVIDEDVEDSATEFAEGTSTASDDALAQSLGDVGEQASESSDDAASVENHSEVEADDDRVPAARSAGADILPFARKEKPQAPSIHSNGPRLPASREFGAPIPGTTGSAPPPMAPRRSGPQEVVKVSADLLEELVNLAGETSISRGRLEEQNSEVHYAIEEMEATVHRLQEQLRRLDIETEAQMIFRQEQMQEAEDFDPLEMDRYSQLQQLSRSLMESASDLMDLTHTLNDKTRDTETLLLQQSRINTDLQEGLMRSRMVPFSRMVPRLRRIVRQVSTELGKHVSFELDNVEGELDRSVLERMVAPLEHMLRNAVDHGIEPGEERIKAGKPEMGRIVFSLGREGGDVLMRLADDGRGLNLERIRAKAIERGLMSADAKLSDHDIMQFILSAGFSTADKVTQISGRGVGMDVVHSEIKQLGGAMFINSRQGEGTEFIIRLPFTVSVNRALMIQLGDDRYAIPLNTIEGIVRVSPFELEHYYQDENARFEYAGENYRVRYLGTMLDAQNLPRLEGQSLPMPVVLVRTAEHAVALQVDRLMGSREIVVKSLGPQFSAVEGLNGATVMGDGSVVVILDPHAMIRKEMALLSLMQPAMELAPRLEEQVSTAQKVLVVDDSVTVRKVTSRFLEREGYDVITAKDGADALQVLQDHMPDVMLLDIEMPRMDGFEVAKTIRASHRLKHIPIIMITSRTGDKHRERALGLGVNKYMGKPYQEELLLNNIRELIGARAD